MTTETEKGLATQRPVVCVTKGSMSQNDIKRLRDEGYLVVVVKDYISRPAVLYPRTNFESAATALMLSVCEKPFSETSCTYTVGGLQAWMARLMKPDAKS